MKNFVVFIGLAFYLATLSFSAYAASTPTPSQSSIIIKRQAQPPVNVQPAIPQPNLSGSSVPRGTEVTPAEQASTSAPLATPSLTTSSRPANPYDFDPVVTLNKNYKFKDRDWKTSDRYEISRVEGLNSTYVPGEKIAFEVAGWSSILEVNYENGFNVMATLFELPTNSVNRAKTTYNPSTRVWESKFSVPLDNTKEYKILINLYCEKRNSPCTNTFGERTQVDKIFPIQPL